jgi:D-arginine dehydrogenase
MRFKILVVGGGIAGASIAAELATHADVSLLEAETSVGFHTTGRSAAMFMPSYGNATVRALTRASQGFLQDPGPGFAAHPLLHARGLLTVADAEHAAMLDALVYATHHQISIDAALKLVPCLRSKTIVAARYQPEAADIDVDLLLQSYLRMARGHGAKIALGQQVVNAARVAGEWHVTTEAGDTFGAHIVVNAAGAWADDLAALFGVRPLGLSPRRRTMVLIDPPAGLPVQTWPFTMTVQEDVYFRPESGKLCLSPADEIEDRPGDAQPEELDIAIGIDRFQKLVEMPVPRVSHSWAGLRTFAPDRSPVIGSDPAVPGFFWFAGQGGYGIQMAPAAARLGAALVLGSPLPDGLVEEGLALDLLGPARFPIDCPA